MSDVVFQEFLRREAARRQGGDNKPSLKDRIYENVIGRGEVDTPGERLGQTITGTFGSIAEGMVGIPGLLGDIQSGLKWGAEKLGVNMSDPRMQMGPRFPTGAEMREGLSKFTGGVSETPIPGKYGPIAETAAEFAGGSMLMGGPTIANALRFGALPGAASEVAGQATEGTAAEPYARIAGALATPYVAGKIVSPMGGADPIRTRMAEELRKSGVRPTAGQTVGSDALRATEGMVTPSSAQLDDFTSAAMKTIGSASKRATPEALKSAERAIVGQMDDALSGISVIPDESIAMQSAKIAASYLDSAPAATVVPKVRIISEELFRAVKSGKPLSLNQLRDWRSSLGRMTLSKDQATSDAAHAMRRLIDDATDRALTAAGRGGDIAALQAGRTQYRNLLAIEDVATKAGSTARMGVVKPDVLRGAIVRSQGKRSFALDEGTDLASLARAGEGVLEASPTVSAGGVRNIPAVDAALRGGGAGGAALYATQDPAMATAAALAGVAAPKVARGMANQPIMQGYLRNQAVSPNVMDERMINTLMAALASKGGR